MNSLICLVSKFKFYTSSGHIYAEPGIKRIFDEFQKKEGCFFPYLAHPQCSPPLRIMRTLWSLYQMRTTQGIGLEAGGLGLEAGGEGLEADGLG